MSDTGKAVLLTLIYSTAVFVALGITDARYSMTIVFFSTLAFFMVIYVSWKIERTEARLKRYIEAANSAMRKEGCKNELDNERS